MAEEQTSQERTEEPTERRKDEARKKGQVPRSRELNTMMSLIIMALALIVLGGSIVAQMKTLAAHGFTFGRELAFDSKLLPIHLMYMFISAIKILIPFFAVAIIAALAGPILMGGWSFSTQAMAFSFEKISPVKGLGRIFSLKALAELFKALIKFSILMAAAIALFKFFERDILTLAALTAEQASIRAVSILSWVLLLLSAAMVFIVAFDVPFELWNFNRQQRMTLQEVRDEMKETSGRPEVKQRIRTLQREASRKRMMQDVPTADVVITNPTHYSVALSYADSPGSAPRVVAKGKNLLAFNIREIAEQHDVPIFPAPPLARALYAATEVGEEIPGNLYVAVARVLAYLFQMRDAGPTDYIPKPTALEVPEEYANMTDEEYDDGDE